MSRQSRHHRNERYIKEDMVCDCERCECENCDECEVENCKCCSMDCFGKIPRIRGSNV